MLKKLLKYDFMSVFKYWWIAALSSLVLSLGGGWCITVLDSEKELPTAINIIAVLILILVIISYVAFILLSEILVYVRFYKNFFTDEGYLTFTLPVKRSQLLNSKLILSVVTLLSTILICILNVFVMLSIGFSEYIFSKPFWKEFGELWKMLTEELSWYLGVYTIEGIILLLLSFVFSALFLFCCITFASIITKKAKVLCAIAIYYVANGFFSFVFQIFYMFGLQSMMTWLSKLPDTGGGEKPVIALILLGLILFFALINVLMYTLQYWMMDRKLNLS